MISIPPQNPNCSTKLCHVESNIKGRTCVWVCVVCIVCPPNPPNPNPALPNSCPQPVGVIACIAEKGRGDGTPHWMSSIWFSSITILPSGVIWGIVGRVIRGEGKSVIPLMSSILRWSRFWMSDARVGWMSGQSYEVESRGAVMRNALKARARG